MPTTSRRKPKNWICEQPKPLIMKTHSFAKSKWICLLGALMLLAGCGNTDTAQAQPQVVRKKIEGQIARANPSLPPVAAVSPQPLPVPSAVNPDLPPGAANQAPKPPAPASPPPAAVAAQAIAAAQPVAPAPAASLPPAETKPGAPPNPTESQIAALLNIQAPAPYNPKGRIDPFEPLLREEGAQASTTPVLRKKREPQSPLEKIDLGQLKLVAIIGASSGNRALVEESSGKGYIVKEGTYVGLNSGKVVAINLDKVMIEEEYEDAYGKTIVKKKEITLPKPPGEL